MEAHARLGPSWWRGRAWDDLSRREKSEAIEYVKTCGVREGWLSRG